MGSVSSRLKAPWGQVWAYHVLFPFWPRHVACGIFPDQGPLPWEGGVLIPGLPEKSPHRVLLMSLEEVT